MRKRSANFRVSLALMGFGIAGTAAVIPMVSATAAPSAGWSVDTSANGNPAMANHLTGVSCPTATDCWAVGDYGPEGTRQTLIEHGVQGVWTVVGSPDPSQDNVLNGITCVTVGDCWAVGYYVSGIHNQTLIEQDTGSAWITIPSPDTSPNEYDILQGIACNSADDCWAVGYSQTDVSPFPISTLIEHFDGTSWTIVTSPNAQQNNYLNAVSCAITSGCWAVGSQDNGAGGGGGTLIEENTSSGWAVVASPNGNSLPNYLNGVSCVSDGCWAVGNYEVPGHQATLVEENTGAGWIIVSSPNVASQDNILYGTTCVTSLSDCWAVGNADNSTLIEEDVGSGWVMVSSPNGSAAQASGLDAVACSNMDYCRAVGDTLPQASTTDYQTLIEQQLVVSSTKTQPETSSILLGQSATDQATVTGDSVSGSPTGAVRFFVCGPLASASGCLSGGTPLGGGPVALVSAPNDTATATSAPFTPSALGTWCFEAKYSGDASFAASEDGTASECFVVTPATTTVDDSSPSVTYDSWVGVTDPTASGGTYRASPTKGATATYMFKGTGITWVTRKGPFQGIATVTIDGKNKGNVDLYATTSLSFSQSYSGLTSKKHTIVIKVTGTKNASSGNTNVAVDAFIVGLTTTQETSPKVTYDSWAGGTSASAIGGTYRTDGKAKATSSLIFTGTGVTWVTATGPSEGKATVTVDGSVVETVDLYSPTVSWQVSETVTGLTSGSHTILITVLGTKDAASAGTQVVVDAFVIYS